MMTTTQKLQADPFGSLAWNMSLAILALEKLRLTNSIENSGRATARTELSEIGLSEEDLKVNEEEQEALEIVANEFKMLSKASGLSVNELMREDLAALRESLSTVVAIESEISLPVDWSDYKLAGENLSSIKDQVGAESFQYVSSDVLEQTHKACIEFLAHLDKQRPNLTYA